MNHLVAKPSPRFLLACLMVCTMCGLPAAHADFVFGEPTRLGSVIDSAESIACFSSDGLEMYIDSARSQGQGDWDIWVLRRASTDDDWGAPENLGPLVNSEAEDSCACISADGLTLYFSSNRIGPSPGRAYDIYMTTRASKEDPWGQATSLGVTINAPNTTDGEPWISPNALELYFESFRSGGYGRADIYVARRMTEDDPWGEPANLGLVVNSEYNEQWLSLSPDGLLLLFSDNPFQDAPRPGGYGGKDMWMTRRATLSSPWQAPVNLGPQVNGSAVEFCPRISPDGSTLHFYSSRGGDWDNWQAPILPVVDFNGDGRVNSKDTSILVDHWLQDEPSCDIGPMPWGDGIVDEQDLLVLAKYLEPGYRCVLRWKLDEAEGTAACDSIGENEGYVFGGATWLPGGGRVDGALELDGMDDFITSDFVLDPAAAPFRVMTWIKGGAPGQVIAAQSPGSSLGSIWLGTDPTDGTLMTELMAPQPPLDSEAVVTDGQWHEVTLEWDGQRRRLYTDGEEVAVDETNLVEVACDGWLDVGAAGPARTETFWSGLIDDVRVESRTPKP